MNRRTKLHIIFTIIGCVGALLIFTFFLVKSKGLLTRKYVNPKKSFSIRYPINWVFEADKNGAAVIFYSPVENELDYFKENVNVVELDMSQNPVSLETFSDQAIDQLKAVFMDKIKLLESKPAFLSLQPGYRLEFVETGEGQNMHFLTVWTLKNKKAYQITYTSLASQYEKYLPSVELMISSFRLK